MKWKLVPCYLLMPIFQQAYFPLHNPVPFPIISERQIHFLQIKTKCQVAVMGGVKKPEKLQMESVSLIPLINGISFLLQDGSKKTVAVIWLNTFQICSWSHVIFPPTERRGHLSMRLLNPLIQPSLDASHIDLHVLPTEPASLSALKDQQLNCKTSFPILIRLQKNSWFAFFLP